MTTKTVEKLITSDQKDRIADLVREATKTAINKVNPTSASAQTKVITRTGEFKNRVEEAIISILREMTTPNKYVNQVVQSNYTYPQEFQRKPEVMQVEILAKEFGLDPKPALEYLKKIEGAPSILPAGCHPEDGNFAILSPFAGLYMVKGYKDPFASELYCKVLLRLFKVISKKRSFTNWRVGEIDVNHLRQSISTLEAYRALANEQGESPIWIVPTQLGFLHKGESVNRAREIFMDKEIGLGSVAGTSIAVTHPERFVRNAELDMDLPGDEFAPGAGGVFSGAPVLDFCGGLGFGTGDVSDAGGGCGSASVFLPQ